MSDWKSKLPDLNELASMSSKLFNGVKNSVVEIIDDYKKKREAVPEQTVTTVPAVDTKTKEEEPIAASINTSQTSPNSQTTEAASKTEQAEDSEIK